jgi:hypothetical protein
MDPSPKSTRPKRRRLPWILAGTALFLIAAVAIAVPLLLDPESYRGHIEEGLRSATGWDADLGEIDFSVMRGFVLTVSPAKLASPDNESRLEISRIEVKAEVLPLIKGELKVNRVDLVSPEVVIVRDADDESWNLPIAKPSGDEPAAAAPDSGDGGFTVSVETIRIRDGRIAIEDRTADPPLVAELREFELTLEPELGQVAGSAELGDSGGTLGWQGSLDRGLQVELGELPTESLHRWIGPELVHPGGKLSGEVTVATPFELKGTLRGTGITLLSGERPLDTFGLEFSVTGGVNALTLEGLTLDAAGLTVEGSGPLFPETALRLGVPEAQLETLLSAADSILPLPFEVAPPGEVEASFLVSRASDGSVSYEGAGTLSAARFLPSEILPPIEDVAAEFGLTPSGALTVTVLEGRIGGGPVQGTARLVPIYPPGKLTFDGGLQEAVLGQLLAGFIGPGAEQITGMTQLDASVGLDLSNEALDARALSGQLELDSSRVSLPGWDLEGALHRQLSEKLGSLAALAGLQEGGEQNTGEDELLDDVKAKLDFDQWPWRVQRLALSANKVSADGQGTFDPIAGVVQFEFEARLTREETNALVAKNGELRYLVDDQGRLAVPMRIEGPLMAPTISADLEDALSEGLEREAEDKLKDLVKGLLDRD